MSERMPDGVEVLEVLELLGFKFGLDWDDSLTCVSPASIDVVAANRIVAEFRDAVRDDLLGRRYRDLRRCNGGPRHGRVHNWLFWMEQRGNEHVAIPSYNPVHVARAKWAVYRCDPDQRAYFVGYAKSKRKARLCQLFEAVATPRAVPDTEASDASERSST